MTDDIERNEFEVHIRGGFTFGANADVYRVRFI